MYEDARGVLYTGTLDGLFIRTAGGNWVRPDNDVLREQSVKDITEGKRGGIGLVPIRGLCGRLES